jgi:hypothetical protein
MANNVWMDFNSDNFRTNESGDNIQNIEQRVCCEMEVPEASSPRMNHCNADFGKKPPRMDCCRSVGGQGVAVGSLSR